MGDMGDDFRAMNQLRLEHRRAIEPERFKYAVKRLREAGHEVEEDARDDKCLVVNGYIKFWPFTGWYAGKGIGSGRGIDSLVKALQPKKGEE